MINQYFGQQYPMQQPMGQGQMGEPFALPVTNNVNNHIMSQAEFMRKYNDETREHFNDKLFQRSNEEIIEEIEKVILSCQRDKYFTLKVVSFRVVMEYEEIHRILREYENSKAKKGKKNENQYDYIDLRDSDIMLLIVNYHIKINTPEALVRIDPKTNQPEETECDLQVLIALPRFVDKYYFRISGNYYSAIFQIVDGSTYNNSTSTSKTQSITLKTMFMPIRIFRESETLIDISNGNEVRGCIYTSIIFSKKLDAMKYILGRYGLYGTYELLEIHSIHIGLDPYKTETNYNFEKEGIVISVPRLLFDEDAMVQSLVCTIYRSIKAVDYDLLFDPRYWNRSLGGEFKRFTLEKGIPVLDSLESIYDIKTKESIRLPMEDKQTVYHILRWMMREFSALRLKDNLDISTKKIRIAEYIASLYAVKLSKGIYRISDEGKNIKLNQVKRAIVTTPMYIFSVINKSKLINYVDLVNDNDAMTALAYTYKGISGLGDQAGSAIPIIYRSVHPSHLGRTDLDSSSSSDPGLSGTLCPMAKLYGDSFSDYEEPNTWKSEYDNLMQRYKNLIGQNEALTFKKKLGFAYDYIKDDMVKETLSTYKKLICPVIDMNGKIDYSLNKSINMSIKGYSNDGVGDIEFGTDSTEDDEIES